MEFFDKCTVAYCGRVIVFSAIAVLLAGCGSSTGVKKLSDSITEVKLPFEKAKAINPTGKIETAVDVSVKPVLVQVFGSAKLFSAMSSSIRTSWLNYTVEYEINSERFNNFKDHATASGFKIQHDMVSSEKDRAVYSLIMSKEIDGVQYAMNVNMSVTKDKDNLVVIMASAMEKE